MKFFKILFQSSKKTIPLYKQVSMDNTLIGVNGYSFGVQYNPESYNTWLMDDNIFKIFVHSSVKQLIMTNHKFLSLIAMQDKFNLNIVDCKLKNIELDYLLHGEKINSEILISAMENQEYQIKEVYFRSKDKHLITLKSNGVLGIDSGLSENDVKDIKKLVDYLSFGPMVIV